MEKRILTTSARVPSNALYKGYHMPGRIQAGYHASDLATDILGRGNSSRLYQTLVRDQEIFTNISAYILGSIDPGMLMFSGRVAGNRSPEEAEKYLDEVVQRFVQDGPTDEEMEKVRNQTETGQKFSEVEIMNRAFNLAYASMLGDPNLINTEWEDVRRVTGAEVREQAGRVIREENANVLYYQKTA